MAGVAADLSVPYRKKQNVGQCTRRDHYGAVTHRCPRTDILLPACPRMRISALQMWTRILAIFEPRFKTRERGFAIQVLVTYRLSGTTRLYVIGRQHVDRADPSLV
jgi:hypothetical protein